MLVLIRLDRARGVGGIREFGVGGLLLLGRLFLTRIAICSRVRIRRLVTVGGRVIAVRRCIGVRRRVIAVRRHVAARRRAALGGLT